MEEKNLQLDRLVFFCDAVVAIAITLLVFNLKIDHIAGSHLTFKDVLLPWHSFLAFLLSFFNIASFWKNHHSFFSHIKRIDEPLLWMNICWLFFIILLPFTTSLVSSYFTDAAAIFAYSFNTLLITVFQNTIWDYAVKKNFFTASSNVNNFIKARIRVFCNFDMLNAGIAVAVSFFMPVVAFILLLTKIPMILFGWLYFRRRAKRRTHK